MMMMMMVVVMTKYATDMIVMHVHTFPDPETQSV